MSGIVSREEILREDRNSFGIQRDYVGVIGAAITAYRSMGFDEMVRCVREYPLITYTERAAERGYDMSHVNETAVQALNAIAHAINVIARDGVEDKKVIDTLFNAALNILSKYPIMTDNK